MEELNLMNVMSLVNTMGGSLKSNRLEGRVKVFKTFPETWTNPLGSYEGYTELQYFNDKGLNIRSEYFQKDILIRSSFYEYKSNLIVSEKTFSNKQELIVYSEFNYYNDNKIRSTKETRLDEDSKTTLYDVDEEFFYYNSLNNIEKREQNNYSIPHIESKVSNKESCYTFYEYDDSNRIIKESNFDESDNITSVSENYYNDLGQLIRDKQTHDDSYYTTEYNYDKKGSLFSSERYKEDEKIYKSLRKNIEKKDIELITKLGSEFECISEDEHGRTVWSSVIKYDTIGNMIKKTSYENSDIMIVQKFELEYY